MSESRVSKVKMHDFMVNPEKLALRRSVKPDTNSLMYTACFEDSRHFFSQRIINSMEHKPKYKNINGYKYHHSTIRQFYNQFAVCATSSFA